MPISKPHSTLGASNTSSCVDLALYLEKENIDLDKLLQKAKTLQQKGAIESRKQFFFTHSKNNISTNQVISTIDSNINKLGKKDAKYFAPTISFSQNELNHILYLVTKKKKKYLSVWDLKINELKRFNELILQYTRLIMNNYAKNFNRENKGLLSGKDLVYFAKIEHFRKFKGTDTEVIKGIYKTGHFKPGINSHVHLIVSRKDKTQRLKLTPTTKERSTTRKIGGNIYHVGFDRMKWINMNERSFDTLFNYKRSELEKFNNQYILKNGSPKEKTALLKQIETKDHSIKNSRNYVKNNSNYKSKRRYW